MIKNILRSRSPSTWLYLAVYALFLARTVIRNTTFSADLQLYGRNLGMMLFIGAVLMFIKMRFFDRFRYLDLSLIFLIVTAAVCSYASNAYSEIIIMALLLIGAKNISLDDIVKCHFTVYASISVAALLCALTGIIDHYIIHSAQHGIRLSLGNTYPTDFAAGILFLALDLIYLKRDRWHIGYSIGMAAISVIVLLTTKAKTNALILFLCGAVSAWYYLTKTGRRLINSDLFRHLTTAAFPVSAVLCIYAHAAIDPVKTPILRMLNVLMNYRLGYGNKAIAEYGLTLFGQRIDMVGLGWGTPAELEYFYVDNGYMQLALLYGLIPMALVCIGLAFISYRSKCRPAHCRGVIPLILSVMALSAIMEPRFYSLTYSAFILAIAPALFEFSAQEHEPPALSEGENAYEV